MIFSLVLEFRNFVLSLFVNVDLVGTKICTVIYCFIKSGFFQRIKFCLDLINIHIFDYPD